MSRAFQRFGRLTRIVSNLEERARASREAALECRFAPMIRKPKTAPVVEGSPPTPAELRKLLGTSHAAWETLASMHDGSTWEWKRLGKNAPWAIRVSRGERTLCYVKPAPGAFEVIVLLGPRATEAALAGRVSKRIHAAIREARVYAEGRPVRQVIKSEAGLAVVKQLIAVKLAPEGKR